MRAYKIVLIIFGVLVLLVVTSVAALFFIDPSAYRNQLERRVSAAFGREFSINGPISLERSLRPRIIIEDITIGNPAWATHTHFAKADEVSVQAALLPLLLGDLIVLDVSFAGVNLFIEEGPDGANNYTLGDRDAGATPGVLPPIERVLIEDSTIYYQTADGKVNRFEINNARLWNIPGEPERIEGQGAAKGKTFTFALAADTAAELSGPQNPWTAKLNITGPDVSIIVDGRMAEAFKWEKSHYRITVNAKEADSLEQLFGVDLPTTGPFELSAKVNKDHGSFSLTDIAAQIQGPPETPAIIIAKGEASGGRDDPLHILLQGQIGDVPVAFTFASAQPLESATQETPWPIEAQLNLADIKLNVNGEMIPATVTERFNYHLAISGKNVGPLEKLLGVELPIVGPFELSANANKDHGAFKLTDIASQIQGPPETPAIKIAHGEAFIGREDPFRITLQGQFGDEPLEFRLASAQPIESLSTAIPWPIETQLNLADTKLSVKGAMTLATEAKQFNIDTQLQGDSFQTLAQFLNVELPVSGPYQLSFHAQLYEGNYTLTDLKGDFKNINRWKRIRILQGEASALASGPIKASIGGRLDRIPLNMAFQGRPKTPDQAKGTTWGINLEALAAGATLQGKGSIITTERGKVLQMATRFSGNRLEALEPLIGVSLPAIGKFNLSTEIRSDGPVHEAKNLKIQIGVNRLTGSARWEDKTPRPSLTGKLSSDRLTLDELLRASSHPSSKTGKVGIIDRPITLDWLKKFDAKLDLSIRQIIDSPLPIQGIKATMTLTNGKLKVPFGGKVSGAAINGQIKLNQRRKIPVVSLQTKIRQLDVGQISAQLKFPDSVSGTADVVDLQANSTGKTLRSLSQQAAFTIQVKPANLSYTTDIISQTATIRVASMKLAAQKEQPITIAFSGTAQDIAFNATASSGNLAEILQTDKALPVRVDLQTTDTRFKAEGTFPRPININAFDLKYELSGKEIEGLDPLFDFVVPLSGPFRTQGNISARGQTITYKEDLRIGKSDLRADITVFKGGARPQITGQILARKISLADMDLVDTDQESASSKDRGRVIPNYTLPVDVLSAVDLDLEIKIERIDAGLEDIGDFGDLAAEINLKNGQFKSTTLVTGFTGARMRNVLEYNTAVDPPMKKIQLTAQNLDYGLLLYQKGLTDILDGRINLYVDLSGTGTSRHEFLANANGYIKVVGGSGNISSRMLDLWAADLITTMLSPSWQREAVSELNCFVTHVELKDGLAEIEDLLLDTQRITIAGSGTLDLATEELNLIIAPRPKRASLVSLANPVRIGGTLSEPEVAVTRLPRGRRLAGAGAGLFAGLVNPAFLLLTFSDTGTGYANPCDAAVERAYENMETGSPSE